MSEVVPKLDRAMVGSEGEQLVWGDPEEVYCVEERQKKKEECVEEGI